MKIFLVVTIDVEPDCSPTWHYSNPLTFNGVSVGIKEILQPLFNKYGIIPTYLINNVVLEDEYSVNVFKSLTGEFELGTHLHPEFMEPEKTVYNYAGSKGEANCCFYKPEIEFLKIQNITNLFIQKFGYQPLSFRAGRFSAGKNTIGALSKFGYKVDTSVTPKVLWDDKTRQVPIDFREISNQPFFVDNLHFPYEGLNGNILEVPVTIESKKDFFLKEWLKIFLGHPVQSRPIWLRPYWSDINNIKWIVKTLKDTSNYKGNLIFNMMFHNVEVMQNMNPYTTDAQKVKEYLGELEDFFRIANAENMISSKLSILYDVFRK